VLNQPSIVGVRDAPPSLSRSLGQLGQPGEHRSGQRPRCRSKASFADQYQPRWCGRRWI